MGTAGNVAPARRCGCRAPSALFVAIAIVLVTIGTDVGAQYWSAFRRPDADIVLEGNWQSCREADGQYAERIFDHHDPQRARSFEFHLGPYHQFAWFAGEPQDEHRDHDSPANLLQPYTIEVGRDQLGRHVWMAPGYRVSVELAGGSREACESWFVSITRR